MFFKPRLWEREDVHICFADAILKSDVRNEYLDSCIQKIRKASHKRADSICCRTITLCYEIPDFINEKIGFEGRQEEGYALQLGETTVIYANRYRGFVYGLNTLLQLLYSNESFHSLIWDFPDCPIRGYRMYLPGSIRKKAFLDVLDYLAYYKYNSIILELGGAMEYHKHPEINEAWKNFASDVRRYSGRAHEIQRGMPWRKNSIHADNGDGEILPQTLIKDLIDACRIRGLEVIPEVPSLSHTDYICIAHKDIAERQNDPYPDTYCPSNPKSYEILFDIIDEVIELFNPKQINIGHDEYYSAAICPECKDRHPAQIFADDVIKIHDYLKQKGVKTMMWGEKLLPVITTNGKAYGGSESPIFHDAKGTEKVPAIYPCQHMLPKDILMLHWYHSFGPGYDWVYHTHGYPMVFGNMVAESIMHWRDRINWGCLGGFCSNWGSCLPEYMQRNNQYLHLVFGAYAMWSSDYDNDGQPDLLKKVFKECYRNKYQEVKNIITVRHTTEYEIPYRVFYDGIFIEEEKYLLGYYVAAYESGETFRFPVVYGGNIASGKIECGFGNNEKNFNAASLDEKALGEVSYSTLPFRHEGKTYYETVFVNPYPHKKLISFDYEPVKDAEVKLLDYCVAENLQI